MDYSPGIQPIINARRFAAFPSGHATEAFVVARMLQMVTGQSRVGANQQPTALETQLQRLAARISNNRVIAGVHFPIDATAGRLVAETVCEYVQHRCAEKDAWGGATGWDVRHFNGHSDTLTDDYLDKAFDRSESFGAVGGTSGHLTTSHAAQRIAGLHRSAVVDGTGTGLLPTVWRLARAEWS